MKRVSDYTELLHKDSAPRVVTIGNFDGVHLGHQAVLRAARAEADRLGLALAVLTFDPHPAQILKPEGQRLRLVEPDRKAALLAACGVDLALFQRFDAAFAALDAQIFATQVLAGALKAKRVLVGGNFRFGRRREAGIERLDDLGETLGFEVLAEPLVRTGDLEISSSRIRQVLIDGDVSTARALLGRCHEVSGRVVKGREMGNQIGFPTLNLADFNVLKPGPGIYAALCDVDGRTLGAAAYIGDRPTMDAGFAVEAHLLDFHENLYGKRVVLRFVDRIRDDVKFEDTAQLVRQIAEDVRRIRTALEAFHG